VHAVQVADVVDLEARTPVLIGDRALPVLAADLVEGNLSRGARQRGAGRVVAQVFRVGTLVIPNARALGQIDRLRRAADMAPEEESVQGPVPAAPEAVEVRPGDVGAGPEHRREPGI